MDSILSKETTKKENLYKDNVLEGPRCEDIKQEIEDIEINDDMESFTTTSNPGSEYGDETNPLPSLTPAPQPEEKVTTNKVLPAILPNLANFAIPIQSQPVLPQQNGISVRPNGMPSLPFPLIIVQQKPQTNNNDKNTSAKPSNVADIHTLQQIQQQQQGINFSDMSTLLKDLLSVQKESLSIERERLELEKERLDYHRNVGNQLLTLIPIVGSLLQKIAHSNDEISNSDSSPPKNGKKRKHVNDDILRESKILRTVLEKNIKKYMLGDDYQEDSDKDDSGIGSNEELSKKKK
ncbi:hypothetical protein WA026_001648 [Henosepilachna vigintioctopunctata]